ncbi:MAG: hypothetical protein KF781_07485 [Chitinophagaceae bacterium]|nr:hypothetical protein [Chitinophagaceae bacterium]MCW5905596.1 hypothetical protein [Chitinophagaceae bacterium]
MIKKIFAPKVYPINEDLTKMWFVKYYDAAGRAYKKCGNLSKYNDLCSLLSEHLEHKRLGMELKSYQSYFSILKHFTQWYRLAVKTNKKINPAEYIRDLQLKGLHKNTIANKMIVLKSLANELPEYEQILKNPFDKVKTKKVKGQSKLPFIPYQIDLIKNYPQENDTQL